MLAIFTNKTLNYKVHTSNVEDSTRNHTLIYKVYDLYFWLTQIKVKNTHFQRIPKST